MFALGELPRGWKLKLGIKESHPSSSLTHLRACDNSKRLVLDTILLSINVDPIEKNMKFQMLDILATFNLILCCPWLHVHQVVPLYVALEDENADKRKMEAIKDSLYATITLSLIHI